MSETLAKLTIKNIDTGETFAVLFNPTEYSIEDASEWSDQEKMGQKPELHYTGGARKKLSMELSVSIMMFLSGKQFGTRRRSIALIQIQSVYLAALKAAH